MPVTRNRRFTLDNGAIAEVDFEIRHFSWSDFELNVTDAWLFKDRDNAQAPRIALSDNEHERFESEVAAHIWDYIE
ncbi:hypothetical protein [Hyphomicrobium sp. DY-1]|uniref:hypothetical protein n=1 Tax=Hyphomicrobium sp. DY-1 TaxID=3075650 RepID=UPI0039C32C69